MQKKGECKKLTTASFHGVRNTGEYTSDWSRGPSAPSTSPAPAKASGRLVDGPYGGRKPQS
jgi:hypothetical protein